MQISSQRLTGIIAGVFAIRTFDAAMAVFTQLLFSLGEVPIFLPAVAPQLVGTVMCGLICWIYLKERQARWQHIMTIVLLSFGILFGGFMIVTALTILKVNTASLAKSMIARGTIQIILSLIAIWIVSILLKRKKLELCARVSADE